MTRQTALAAALLVTIALAFQASAAQGDKGGDKPGDKAGKAKTHKVSIKDLKYDPAKLTVNAGDTVVWSNNDDNDHTVIADTEEKGKPIFASGNIGRGDTFKHTFKDKGKFGYHCSYHPRMKGTITVD